MKRPNADLETEMDNLREKAPRIAHLDAAESQEMLGQIRDCLTRASELGYVASPGLRKLQQTEMELAKRIEKISSTP